MIDLFVIYQYAFFVCLIAGISLSFVGAHLVARNESLQVLALAQAALVGNLIGRLLFPGGKSELGIILSSLLFFLVLKFVFVFSRKLVKKSKETFFVVIYLSLISISYLLISIFPGLEGHMAVGFFGDIVSLPKETSLIVSTLFVGLLILFYFLKKRLVRMSFERAILGSKRSDLLEEVLFAIVFVISLYSLGFLYSVSIMIFPTVVVGNKGKSMKSILIFMLIIAAIGSMVGLAGSIVVERLSTVPTQVLTILVLLLTTGVLFRSGRKLNNE